MDESASMDSKSAGMDGSAVVETLDKGMMEK
jgi:hypothetical protein